MTVPNYPNGVTHDMAEAGTEAFTRAGYCGVALGTTETGDHPVLTTPTAIGIALSRAFPAIEGCLEWQRHGLAAPPAVLAATAEYLEAEDAQAQWLAECCTQAGTFLSSSSELFASWRTWAEAAGEQAGSQKRFSQALMGRGFQAERLPHNGKAGFRGIAVRPSQDGSNRYGD